MKFALILSILFFSYSAFAVCKNKIDSSKVMMFVDVNESDLEIITAEKAACARGQKLVVIPNDYKVYSSELKKADNAKIASEKCLKTKKASCTDLVTKAEEAQSKYEEFLKNQKPYKDQIRDEFQKIQNDKAKLENFTISGHDGGGDFGGKKARIGRSEIQDVVKDFPDINNVKSVLLLGCYTGVPKEISQWMQVFPDLKLMGGFDGSAPLAFRPEGHDYFYNLLTQERQLTTTADQKRIQSVLNKNFKSLKVITAAMYIKPECQGTESDKAFYYGDLGESKGLGEFDVQECEKVKPKLLAINELLSKYDNGEMEPPTETSKSELRTLYSQVRRYEHCSETLGDLASTKAFGLLFFHGIKDNFGNFYKDDLAKVENYLQTLSQSDFDKGFDDVMKTLDQEDSEIKAKQQEIANIEKDPAAYFKSLKESINEREEEFQKLLENPSNKAVYDKFPQLRGEAGFNIPTTTAEIMIYQKLNAKQLTLQVEKRDVASMENNQKEFFESEKSNLAEKKVYLDDKRKKIESGRLTPQDMKNIWIPTKENLAKKTRKEVLENIHNMNGILENPTITEKMRSYISWTESQTERNLQHLMVPFSWHEYTGTTEPVVMASHLEEETYTPSSSVDWGPAFSN